MFWKGIGAETEQETKPEIETQQTLIQHGSIVTEEVVNLLEPEQRGYIEELRKTAKEFGTIPKFHVSLAFDVTKVEEGIPSEADRVEKSRGHRNTAVTKTEIGKDMFPSTAVVWTTIARKRMSEIFTEATGEYVEDEEEEYLCQVEQQRQHKKVTR